jgi:hypothetical protein
MDGASAIAGIRIAWTKGLFRLLREIPLLSTGKVNISSGDLEGFSKTMN